MYRYFLYIYDFLASHRRWATVLLLLLLALMGVLSFQVKYEEDISKFLPQDPKREKFQEVYQQIWHKRRLLLSLHRQILLMWLAMTPLSWPWPRWGRSWRP